MQVVGRAPLTLSRLGRRTEELATLLTEWLRQARGRTAAFLGSLLPGLDPMALREAAGLLRDGVAVPARTLDGIHPDLSRTLVQIAALPDRREAIAGLARHTDLALGFKQLASVRRPAAGVTPRQDHAASPHIGEHDSPGGSFRPGLSGMRAAGVMSGGPPAGPGAFAGPGGWAGPGVFAGPGGWAGPGGAVRLRRGVRRVRRLLGVPCARRRNERSCAGPDGVRPDVTRGRLTPATEDLSALTASGDDPT